MTAAAGNSNKQQSGLLEAPWPKEMTKNKVKCVAVRPPETLASELAVASPAGCITLTQKANSLVKFEMRVSGFKEEGIPERA